MNEVTAMYESAASYRRLVTSRALQATHEDRPPLSRQQLGKSSCAATTQSRHASLPVDLVVTLLSRQAIHVDGAVIYTLECPDLHQCILHSAQAQREPSSFGRRHPMLHHNAYADAKQYQVLRVGDIPRRSRGDSKVGTCGQGKWAKLYTIHSTYLKQRTGVCLYIAIIPTRHTSQLMKSCNQYYKHSGNPLLASRMAIRCHDTSQHRSPLPLPRVSVRAPNQLAIHPWSSSRTRIT